jgi:hypothetical protein
MYDRVFILRWLQRCKQYKHYLEIGCFHNETFTQMQEFETKIGVDPNSGGTLRMTSDDFFAQYDATKEVPFDLVFIDGLHHSEQVLRDAYNALDIVRPGATILFHDCLPMCTKHASYPRPDNDWWNGDVYKAWHVLKDTPHLLSTTCNFDWGIGVLYVPEDLTTEQLAEARAYLESDDTKERMRAHTYDAYRKARTFGTFADFCGQYGV